MRTKLFIVAALVALAVMGFSQIGAKKMADDFVMAVGHDDKVGFFLAKDIDEMDVVTVKIGGGAPDGCTYKAKLKVADGNIQIKATYDDGTNNCDSGWSSSTETYCTCGATGAKARLALNGMELILRFDSEWDTDVIYSGRIDGGAINEIALLDMLVLGGIARTEWYPSSVLTDNKTLVADDLARFILMNSANDKTITLPSVSSVNDGIEVGFGALTGKLTITAVDDDTIGHSTHQSIYTNTDYGTITLKYIHDIETWLPIGPHGTWTTEA